MLNDVRLRARRLIWIYGLSATIAILIALTTSAALFDYFFQVNDPIVRLIVGLGILLTTGRVAWILLVRPLTEPLTNLTLSRQFERLDHTWKDELSSVVQFLEAGFSPTLGSPTLQRRVARETLARLPRLESAEVLQSRPALRVAWSAVGVMLIAAVLVALDQFSAALALERLVRPFAVLSWPKQVGLVFYDENWQTWETRMAPMRAVEGETVQIFIENRLGELPENIAFWIRSAEGSETIEPVRRITIPDTEGHSRDVAVATINVQPGTWLLRASGGDDDDMPWHRLEVVLPPLITELHVTLTPPPYSATAPLTLPQGIGHIEGLIGTQVDIQATTNRPMDFAALRIKDRSGLELKLTHEGTNFSAQFRIEEPGKYAYWFDLKDREGFRNPNARRYEIEGRADTVPEVTLRVPRDDMTVTADAIIPLEIEVRDDQGLDQLFLELSLVDSSSSAPVRQLLTTAIEHISDPRIKSSSKESDAGTRSDVRLTDPPSVKELHWKDDWPLTTLSLNEGTRLNFVAAASDLYDLTPDHIGRSRSRTLTIVSVAQKTAELAARQEQMLKALVDVHRAQRLARDAIRDLNLEQKKSGNLSNEDFELFQRIEREQQQIARQLSGPVTSIRQHARNWLTDFRNNGLHGDEMRDRVADLAHELDWLEHEIYPTLEAELMHTGKRLWNRKEDRPSTLPRSDESTDTHSDETNTSVRDSSASTDPTSPYIPGDYQHTESSNEPGKQSLDAESFPRTVPREKFNSRAPRYSLARIEDLQSTAVDTLDELVDSISDWKDLRTVAHEWQELMDLQAEATGQTTDVSRDTLSKNLNELTLEQQTALSKAATKQQDVAYRLQRFRERIGKMNDEDDQASEDQRDVLNDLSESLAESSVTGQMQEAAAAIRRNDLGQAGISQQNIERELAELRDLLQHKRESDTETLIKKLKQFEASADELITEQHEIDLQSEELAKDTADNIAERLELVKSQQKNIEHSRRLAHKLRREGLEDIRLPFERAGEEMQKASDHLLANEPDQLRKRHDDIEQNLDQGRRELAKSRRIMEQQLAREIIARLEQEVQGLLERQTAMSEEITRLQIEYLANQRWTRGQLKTLRDTGAGQAQIATDVSQIAERLQEAPVFAYSLKHVADLMTLAANRLNERQADELTVEYATTAVRKLSDLMAVLVKSEDTHDRQEPEAQPGDQHAVDGPPSPDLPQTAQVKLLKELQTALRQKTVEWHEKHQSVTELSAEATAQRQMLADEQQSLFELAETLLQSLSGRDPMESDVPPTSDGDKPAEANEAPDDAPDVPENSNESSARPSYGVRSMVVSFRQFSDGESSTVEESPPPKSPDKPIPSMVETAGQLRISAQRIIEAMQAAQRQLSQGDAGSPTQNQQQNAEQAIDELLEQLEQFSSQSPPSDENSTQSHDEKQKRQGTKLQQENAEQGDETGATPNGKRRQDNQPQDSTDSTFSGDTGEENLTVPKKLAKDVWGHLPDSVREQMLNLFSEKYLPRYEDLIRRYYEALADEEMKADRRVDN
ncbi:MAG: hypothetical protein O2955_14685 [Planctomycetota bacterium]|nr:hypothetical protein [Planctomycetota bacterium]